MLTKFLLLFVIFTPDSLPFDIENPEVGTYPIYYSQEDSNGEVGTTANFTYVDSNTIVTEELAIYAHNIYVTSEDNIKDEAVIALSEAVAWNVTTAEKYTIEKIEYKKIDEELYEATLHSVGELARTIEIKIVDDNFYKEETFDFDEEYKLNFKIGEHIIFYNILVYVIILILYIILFIIIKRTNKKIRENIDSYNQSNANVKDS